MTSLSLRATFLLCSTPCRVATTKNTQLKNNSYGGVVARPNIAAAADWSVYSIQPLIDALP